MKGMQEKESIMGVRDRQRSPFLGITVWHHSASLVMPDNRDGFLNLPHTPMIDSYIIQRIHTVSFGRLLSLDTLKVTKPEQRRPEFEWLLRLMSAFIGCFCSKTFSRDASH